MKKNYNFYDFLTPKEQKCMDRYVEKTSKIVKELKRLESARARNTRKTIQLMEIAEKRMDCSKSKDFDPTGKLS